MAVIPGDLYTINETHTTSMENKDVILLCTEKIFTARSANPTELFNSHCMINVRDGTFYHHDVNTTQAYVYINITQKLIDAHDLKYYKYSPK